MADHKDILDFINSYPVPTGMIQAFIGERPESPDDADMSKMVAAAPARWLSDQIDLDQDVAKVINDNFWDLI